MTERPSEKIAKNCFASLTKEQASRVQEILDCLPAPVKAFVYENVAFTARAPRGFKALGSTRHVGGGGKAVIYLRGIDTDVFWWFVVYHEIAHAVLGHHLSYCGLVPGRIRNPRLQRLRAERDAYRQALEWRKLYSQNSTTTQENRQTPDNRPKARRRSGGSVH